ncbi:(-)-germacrene D synthase-like [Pistacia vera]|uniref:(-)-germacrene D synthase-like n=1 Tax=Pistacia vera TaxID=55513 RepID=UPI00126301C8|nr:(-)-germacrene D synthase-like [Pistacia vera]
MLNLHEAAHFAIHGEDILDEALAFTATQLKSMASRVSSHLAEEINHTLKFPIRKTVPRYETRFFLSTYARDNSRNKTLLKFAKLDCNILKVRHQKQKQLSDILKWDIGAIDMLPDYIKFIYKSLLDFFAEMEEDMSKVGRAYSVDCPKKMFEQKRGHVPSAVECYMHGVSEDVAVEFLLKQVADAWKDVNEPCSNQLLCHCLYLKGFSIFVAQWNLCTRMIVILMPSVMPPKLKIMLPHCSGTQYFEVSTSITVNVNKAGKL